MSDIRSKTIQGLSVGDQFVVTRTFSEKDTLTFGDITRDYNPVHFDERFTSVKKFEGLICHGLLVGSMLAEIGGQIGWLASGMDFRFKRPVYFGDTTTCEFTILEIQENGKTKAEAIYQNHAGSTVLEAALYGILPSVEERQVMRAMVAEGDPTNKRLSRLRPDYTSPE